MKLEDLLMALKPAEIDAIKQLKWRMEWCDNFRDLYFKTYTASLKGCQDANKYLIFEKLNDFNNKNETIDSSKKAIEVINELFSPKYFLPNYIPHNAFSFEKADHETIYRILTLLSSIYALLYITKKIAQNSHMMKIDALTIKLQPLLFMHTNEIGSFFKNRNRIEKSSVKKNKYRESVLKIFDERREAGKGIISQRSEYSAITRTLKDIFPDTTDLPSRKSIIDWLKESNRL